MKEIYEKLGLFYLGKDSYDETLTLYKSKDLTTHAAIIGMTGSGKTGLGITLIEEAAIDNVPVLVIDPKGDMGNLCLAFSKMRGEDFRPWMDESDAAAKGKSVEELAQDAALMWKNGLESFAQDLSRVENFAKVEKTIYTPGSSAGVGVNVLGSFEAPSVEILEDSDTFSSLINATVSSLLSLVAIQSDSLNSKESLLLSNVFHHYWSQGVSLSLEDLIGAIASPPFTKVGVLSLQSFYPQNERLKLAMLFNGLLSSVTFSSWLQGEALDVQNVLYDKNGKAKVAIFSIAHLNDNERMFFVTILLNAYLSWMRRQRGSSTLKAVLYMDEIFGFFPPSKNPPSKEPMLTLLKQARAFGTGIVLSTQNPVDLDYKGLSNIGTWFIGKLQTKQDIEKVLDGLSAKSDLSKERMATKIATLKGRRFILKNVHEDKTREFETRWTLSYLKGPMTKDDVRLLMKDKKRELIAEVIPKEQKSSSSASAKPIISQTIKEYFNDSDVNAKSPFYPYLYGEVTLKFYNQRKGIDLSEALFYKLDLSEDTFSVNFEDAREEKLDKKSIKANQTASYANLPNLVLEARNFNGFERELVNFIYHSKNLELFTCKDLKLESKLGESRRDFLVTMEDALKEMRDENVEKIQAKHKTRYERLENKLETLQRRLQKERSDVSAKTTDTIMEIGLAVFGAFFGSKNSALTKSAAALKKGHSVFKERDDVQNVESSVERTRADMRELLESLDEEVQKLKESLRIENFEIETLTLKPRRSDVILEDFALLWER